MHHLWNYSSTNNSDLQEQQIVDYIDKKIIPQAETIDLAGKALEYLVEKGTDWAVDGAAFTLLKLQDFLYDKYLLANERQKEIFKNKILEKFPNSGLANKLRNEFERKEKKLIRREAKLTKLQIEEAAIEEEIKHFARIRNIENGVSETPKEQSTDFLTTLTQQGKSFLKDKVGSVGELLGKKEKK
ncbi:8403_t:CDS:2 [Ambispora leptoticha]|uniref:8403_t:CDS:1 n=1 Tax=Ambispora leptoticha TaxID=144679 RepID=A0A9N8YK52_9GLOM|nr:8403_t:CDS:2 [Ambispora leptoticha]